MSLQGKSVRVDVPFEGYLPGTFGVNPLIYSDQALMNVCAVMDQPHVILSCAAYLDLIGTPSALLAFMTLASRRASLKYGLVGEIKTAFSFSGCMIFTDAYRPKEQRLLPTEGISHFCVVPPEVRIHIPAKNF